MCFSPVATHVLSLVLVSVTRFSLQGGVVGPTLDTTPLSGLGTGKSLRRGESQVGLITKTGEEDENSVAEKDESMEVLNMK